MDNVIDIPASGATIEDYVAAGEKWGASMGVKLARLNLSAQNLGALTEDVSDNLIQPGWQKDWTETIAEVAAATKAPEALMTAFVSAAKAARDRAAQSEFLRAKMGLG